MKQKKQPLAIQAVALLATYYTIGTLWFAVGCYSAILLVKAVVIEYLMRYKGDKYII